MTRQLPWTIDDAADALRDASKAQKHAEEWLKHAAGQYAQAERAYREGLATTITRLRADGIAATTCADLARGDKAVAELRMKRDICEGVKEAAVQAGWRASADRRDAQALAGWSQAREIAEGYAPSQGADVRPLRGAA